MESVMQNWMYQCPEDEIILNHVLLDLATVFGPESLLLVLPTAWEAEDKFISGDSPISIIYSSRNTIEVKAGNQTYYSLKLKEVQH